MKIRIIGFLSLAIFVAPVRSDAQIVPGTGANTEDPKKVLLAAERAASRLSSMSYDGDYQGIGSIATRSFQVIGKIKLSRLKPANPLMVKVASEGDYYSASKEGGTRHFAATFTGTTTLSLRSDKKIVTRKVLSGTDPKERNLGFVTQRLGVPTDALMMYELFWPKPFEKQLAGEVIEYEGRTTVSRVLCHVIYVEFDMKGRIKKQRWFIGIEDNLPRRVETIGADDKDRYGAYVLSLSNLKFDIPMGPQTFAIRLPKGYKIIDYEPEKPPQPLGIGETAPEWSLADPLGKLYRLSDYRGKVIILDFWSTWCGPCVRYMPEIQVLYDKFQKRGVEVFGVNSWEDGNAPAYFKGKGYTYGLLLGGEKIAESYRVGSLPKLYVIGVGGEIIYGGVTPDDILVEVIEQYLKAHGM